MEIVEKKLKKKVKKKWEKSGKKVKVAKQSF